MDAGRRPARERDLRALSVAFTAGVLIVHALPQLPTASWLIVLTVPALLPWRGRSLWAMLMLGLLLTVWRADVRLAERWPAERHGEEVWVHGRIVSLPERSQTQGEESTWRFQFQPEDASLPQRIRVSWYRSGEHPRGGDCWRLLLRMRTPHGSLNPGGFDYEGWLFRGGIVATASVREAEACGARPGQGLLKLRQALIDRFEQWLPGHPALPLVAALSVGDDSGISDAEWDAFRLTGTSHLIAISGFNVAIVAGFAFFLLRWGWSLWPRLCLRLPAQRAGLLGAALFGLAYAGLAGWDAPVQRAGLMLIAVLAAAWLHRLNQPSHVLALVWIVLLLIDPFAITSPGLWLSFGAVAAIFYVSQGRLAAPGALHGLLLLQLMLSLMLAPLSLYFFHGTAWLSPLVNLVAVPIAAVLTPLLLLAIALALSWPAAGIPALGWVASALERLRDGLIWMAAEAPASWLPASPNLVALLLALAGTVLLFAPRGLPLRPLALLCFLPLAWPPSQAPASDFELTALDVGQGLAVVVRTANHTLLYDAGPAFEDGFDAGESVVAPYLLRQGVRRLDLLLLSHGDNDHAGGVPAVRRLLKVDREIGTDGHPACRAGNAWQWDGVRFELLHPGEESWRGNDSSCVLRISGRSTALLAGDIEAPAEQHLLDTGASLRAAVLVAPHHGSRTSSTVDFVEAVRPQWVIYGAGWRNQYRHPRPEVIERYADIGARQLVTGLTGALRLRASPAEPGKLEAELWRQQSAHFWNAPAEDLCASYNCVGFGASP